MKGPFQSTHKIREGFLFLRRFISEPGQIGSVSPSSRYLVEKLLKRINWSQVHSAVELGAGTGVVTSRILELIEPGTKFQAFELDSQLRQTLELKFCSHILANAVDLPLIAEHHSLDLVVSSLPWTTLPRDTSRAILQGILDTLKPNGQMVAYQYSWQMRRCFCQLFSNVRLHFELRNIPPAVVYDCHGPRAEHLIEASLPT